MNGNITVTPKSPLSAHYTDQTGENISEVQ